MPFGLRNALATFSRLVIKLDDFSGAYLDDVINYSTDWKNHLKDIRAVLSRVRDANLTLSPSKCQFAAAELDYLGHHIGLGRVQPRQKKVVALLAYPPPTNRKQLQVFHRACRLLQEVRAELCPHFCRVVRSAKKREQSLSGLPPWIEHSWI